MVVANNSWVQDLAGALTLQMLLDYLRVWDMVQEVQLSDDVPDTLIWPLGAKELCLLSTFSG